MSGQAIGTGIGFVAGFFLPGGPQVWATVGGAIGGYVDPTQVFGPRLQDATVQTSRVGIPIPFGWGRFPVAGNLLWAGPITEHENSERQGKGGGPEQVTYTYTRSYAIGLCQGMLGEDDLYDPISGVAMVKRNGKIVYDARTSSELEDEFNRGGDASILYTVLAQWIAHQRGASANFASKATFYLGSETQLPDPTMEMHLGAGNVPAYPGLVYMVVEEDDVTESAGAVAQYEVVVDTGGTVVETCPEEEGLLAWWPLDDASGGGVARELVGGYDGVYSTNVGSGGPLHAAGGGSVVFDNFGQYMIVEDVFNHLETPGSYDTWTATVWARVDEDIAGSVLKRIAGFMTGSWVAGTHAFEFTLRNGVNNMRPRVAYGWGGTSTTALSKSSDVSEGARMFMGMEWEADAPSSATGTFRFYLNGELEAEATGTPRPATSGVHMEVGGGFQFPESYQFLGAVSDLKYYNVILGEEGHRSRYLPTGSGDIFAVPDAPGFYVRRDGTIISTGCGDAIERQGIPHSTIVAGLLRRVGLTADQFDVSQLTDLEQGVRFANVSGADLMIAPLMQARRYDKDERDGKLHFVKRGGDVVASIGPDDLVEREGDAIEWTRVQEAELLRKTSVTYLDPAANWAPNTQDAERRVSTVQAKGESVFEVPLCATHDTAKQIADIALKIAWAEPDSCKFSLSLAHSERSVTDVIALTDKAGNVHRVRIEQIEEDSGVLLVEARRDRQSTYTSNVQGVAPPPPRVTTPGLIGPTQLAVMDLPVLRDADDKLGVYVAARGILSGWNGAALYLSTDGGVSGGIVATVDQASTIGYTGTALVADVSSEYPSEQTLQVWLPSAPSSVDYATLLRYNNRAALQLDSGEWEVLQYQTVTDDGDGLYTLSGLVRGRYATTPGAAAAGNTFVLLDATVQFVECERWMIGASDMQVKAVSFGTNADSYAWQEFTFTTPASQTEWPVYMVEAERDGSDNVTVTGYVRARLGVETAPYHSQFFAGVRITYSDGETFDVTPNATTGFFTHTRSSAPASQDITVAALNSITGAGPASEAITV